MNDREKSRGSQFPLTNNSAPSEPQTPAQTTARRPQRRPRTLWTYLKWISITCFLVMAMTAGVLAGLFSRNPMIATIIKQDIIHPGAVIRNLGNPLAAFTPDIQFEGQDQHVFNLAVFGCDVDYEDGRPVAIKDSRGRSDAILLAHIDFDNNTVHVVSIPRDTACRIPDHGVHKINAAISFGGHELATQTIESVFGIHVDHYIVLNYFGFKKMVDAVGGVDLTVEKKLNYDDNWGNLHVHLKPGFQHLNGTQAMGYVRIRHSDDDLTRSERQHTFLEAVREKVENPANFGRLPDALNAITDSIHSDLKNEQLLTVANFARQLPKERVNLTTLPVIEGPSYVYVKIKESEEMLQKIFSPTGDPITINVPSYDIVRGLEGRGGSGRHHKGRRRGATATTPQDDNAGPTFALPDDTIPPPDDNMTSTDMPSTGDADKDKPANPADGNTGDKTGGDKDKTGGDSGKTGGDNGKTGGDSDTKDKPNKPNDTPPTTPKTNPGTDDKGA